MPQTISIPKRTVNRERLPNGSVLLYAPNPYNNIVAIRVMSRLASRHETADKAGMANLAMRLISSGTKNFNENQIADNLERNGANFKAESGKDWSTVNLLSTTENLREDLAVVMDLIDNPTFPEKKITRERELVRMTIMEQEDSHLNYTVRRFREIYYGDAPYAWPSIGKTETLDAISRDDLVHFTQMAFDPSQLIISVVGDADYSDVQAIVKDAFTERVQNTALTLPNDVTSQPAIMENKQFTSHRQTESEYIVMGYPGEGLRDASSPVMRVVAGILGGSMDSRLFREIRDKRGLCYQVGSSYTPQLDHSPLLLYVVTTPSNRMEAITCAEAEIEKLKNEPVQEDELNRVKTYLAGTYVMSMETNMGQASRFGVYETAGLGWDYANQLPDDINKVSAEDIANTAKKFFTQRLLTITAPPIEAGS